MSVVLRIGLTGGIASGKSLVAEMLGQFGARLVDADLVAREVVAPGKPALTAIVEAFGESMLAADGNLDRQRLRAHVFADTQAREKLEALLHPAIRRRMLEAMNEAAAAIGPQSHNYVVAVVPLLVETGFAEHVDRVLVVDCPRETQLARLVKRDDIDERQAEAMLDAQADPERRRAAADDIIDNSGSIACTRAQAWRAHLRYLRIAVCRMRNADAE